MHSKKELRRSFLKKLSLQASKDRLKKSRLITRTVLSTEAFQKSKVVAFYVSMPEEVNTHPLIRRAINLGKQVVVPVCDLKTSKMDFYRITSLKALKKNSYGILEPKLDSAFKINPKKIDFIAVPGVIFDKKNNRLGRGKGFYDRFLKKLRPKTFKMGLAFDFQLVDKIPTNSWDVVLDRVCTN